MKNTKNFKTTLICLFVFAIGFSQNPSQVDSKLNQNLNQISSIMKTYLIEREIPDAEKLTAEQLKGIAQKSNEVISEMGSSIEWVHSYITENKVYCVYKAENKAAIRKHAEKGGFPANSIRELSTIIDPSTAKN